MLAEFQKQRQGDGKYGEVIGDLDRRSSSTQCSGDPMMIQEKAKSLFLDLKSEYGEESTVASFTASKGWFQHFKKRCNFQNIQITGEAASADSEEAIRFVPYLRNIIDEGGYSREQVFNVDEMGLYWKRMPSWNYIVKEEKTASCFKASKGRLTLLLGGNADGDFKLKPLLVYNSENPRVLKGYTKTKLPVIWKSNKSARIMMKIYEEWFKDHFAPSVKDYLKKKSE
jgi:hypothetical protein